MGPVRLRRARSHLARGLGRGYGTSRGRGRHATRVEGASRTSLRPGEGRGGPLEGRSGPNLPNLDLLGRAFAFRTEGRQ